MDGSDSVVDSIEAIPENFRRKVRKKADSICTESCTACRNGMKIRSCIPPDTRQSDAQTPIETTTTAAISRLQELMMRSLNKKKGNTAMFSVTETAQQ